MTSLGRESDHINKLIKQSSTIMVLIGFSALGFIKFGRLFEAGQLLNFHHLQQVCSKLFCNKTIK